MGTQFKIKINKNTKKIESAFCISNLFDDYQYFSKAFREFYILDPTELDINNNLDKIYILHIDINIENHL